MSFKTFVALTAFTASDANDYLMKQVVIVCTSGTRPSSPVTGMHIHQSDDHRDLIYNGSAWVTTTEVGANVATSETTTSATYAALSTAGPIVTLQTGTAVIISIAAHLFNNSSFASNGWIGFAVSGATTVAASDANGAPMGNTPTALSVSRRFALTGLTAGINVFTMLYKSVGGATLTAANRSMAVVGTP